MSETLFRGKRVDSGEWTYGYLFVCWDRCYILWGMSGDNPIKEEVVPETVGEYTGLTDKNGKRIFEGDILSDGDDTYKVVFDEGVFQIENSHYTTGLYVAIHMEKIDEVIGNVYDNFELLEAERYEV